MNIILIGSGHVAAVLGRRMLAAGHRVKYVWSRNQAHALRLSRVLGASVLPERWVSWPGDSDIAVVSVSDDAYVPLAAGLPRTQIMIVHTGGAVPGNVFSSVSPRTGVLYPLQSIRSETGTLPELPLLISASSSNDLRLLEDFALSLSSLVSEAGDETRLKYHVAAVFSANFANHLFALTEAFCRKEDLDFRFLRPLLEETVNRMQTGSPGALQTGPALRGDTGTIQKHLLLLKDDPGMTAIYTLLSKSIMDFYS